MALSGSFYTTYHSYYRLLVEWTATQDIDDNRSSVKANLFLVSTTPYSNVISSAPKTVSLTVNGSTSTKTAANLADLDGNQKKLIHSYTVWVPHNADGTKSVSISAKFDIEVTLTNTFYSTFRTSGTASLNTIPRSSKLTSDADWIAGGNLDLVISRSSSAFTHTARVKVNGKLIKTITGIGTSVNIVFTKSEHTEIFEQLAQLASKSTVVELDTFSGSTRIGTVTTKSGTVTAPTASTFTNSSSFTVGSPITVTISRKNSEFTHIVRLKNGSTILKTLYGIGTSALMTTSDIASTLNALMPTSSSKIMTIEVATYYGGIRVRSPATGTSTMTVASSAPTFTNAFIYKDSNPVTVAVTKNNQYIVQNNSELVVEIPVAARAIGRNGATIKTYTAVFNGVSKIAAYSETATVSFNFGKINSAANGTLSISATDSRGNKTTASKTVNMVAYKAPTIVSSLARVNNFENQTVLKMSGGYDLMNVAGTNVNTLKQVQYRYKLSTTSTWGSWLNFVVSPSGSSYSVTDVTIQLDNTKTYNFEMRVVDALTTKTDTKSIGSGYELVALQILKSEFPLFQWTVNTTKAVGATAVILNGETVFYRENPTFPISYTFEPEDLREGENVMAIWMIDSSMLNHNMVFRMNKSFSLYPETQLTKVLPGGDIASNMTLKLTRSSKTAKSKLYRIIGGVS